MVSLVKEKLDAIINIYKTYKLQKLFMFSSAATASNFTDESDVDFLYKLKSKIAQISADDRPEFFDMLFAFEELLGRPVDLIDLTRVKNLYLIQSINQHKLKLYES